MINSAEFLFSSRFNDSIHVSSCNTALL